MTEAADGNQEQMGMLAYIEYMILKTLQCENTAVFLLHETFSSLLLSNKCKETKNLYCAV